jgi:hypothetical protein
MSPTTPKCRYHFTYAILHNFLPRVEPTMVEAVAAKLEQQEFKCAFTGVPLVPGKNASLDHVYPKLKYPVIAAELTNLVWVDATFNKMKLDADPNDPVVAAIFAPAIVEKLRALAKLVVFPA